jgi:GT2 family glycosyltransferase
MTRLPLAAVVVPVHADPVGVARLLDRIDRVDWPRERLHVIVAVDGADPATVAAASRPGVTVLPLHEQRGSYAARNRAIESLPAGVDLVAFTDADCLPQPQWLRAHWDVLSTGVEQSGGAVHVTLRSAASPAEFVDRMRHLQQERYVRLDHYAATANLAVRRELLDRMRFDERLTTGGDADFGRRAHAAGVSLVYNPDAAVEHPARATVNDLMRKIHRICDGMQSRRDYWANREVSRHRVRLALIRKAREEGVSRGVLWDAQVVALEWWCQRRVSRSAKRAGAVIV